MSLHSSGAAAPVVIDLAAEQLRIGDRSVALRPKTWDVLRALVERPGQLLTKDELLDRVWAGTAVSEGTLNKSIGELRAVLGESSQAPRWIETVSRRGFRWIGEAGIVSAHGDVAGPVVGSGAPVAAPGPTWAEDSAPPLAAAGGIVGRDGELSMLDAALGRARAGQRQVVFVTGEPGAGKSTLLDVFLARAAAPGGDDAVRIATGQCIETSGPHEPYLPLLDAIERLARGAAADPAVTEALQRFAPTWIEQIPVLAAQVASPSGGPSAPAGSARGAAGRLLREFLSAVTELSRHRPLILVVEDAHWADLATVDVCSALARQRDACRLLVVVTMRVADAIVQDHPIAAVRTDLVARGQAREIALNPFGTDDVRDYLARRCPGLDPEGAIGRWMLRQTAGNPLFVRLVVDEWIARGLVVANGGGRWTTPGDPAELLHTIPDSLLALLERQMSQLSSVERTVLEAASVLSGEFRPASIAAAVAMDAEEVEGLCLSIARRGRFLRTCGDAERCAFLHVTIQQVLADSMPATRRRRFHRAAAEQIECESPGRSREAVAAQLAVHYEACGDLSRAIPALRDSAKAAIRRDAHRDAIVILERVLRLIDEARELDDRDGERLHTLSYLSHAHQLAFGFVNPKVAELWSRTSELASSREDVGEQLIADAGRIMVTCVSGRYGEGEELIRRSLPRAAAAEAGVRKTFYFSSACVRYRLAAAEDASQLFEAALDSVDEADPIVGTDFAALLKSQYAPLLAMSGRVDRARQFVRDSVERSRTHSRYSECVTGALASWSLALLHDLDGAAPLAERSLEIAKADGLALWHTRPLCLLGLRAIRDGDLEQGIADVRAGLDARRDNDHWVDHSALCGLFAEALIDSASSGAGSAADHRDTAGALLEEAWDFIARSGERYYESELHRIRAKLRRIAGADPAEVEKDLQRAGELAAFRGLHWHGLLAAADLAPLLVELGRGEDARELLEKACAPIEGGDDLDGLRRARATLERL